MTNLPATTTDVWTPANDGDKMSALAALACLPSRATSSAELDRAGYYLALDGVTRYGLSIAVRAIIQGALNHAFFPSPPELRLQCNKAMEAHERMAENIRRRERENADFNRLHGNPPERTEASKARVAALHEAYRQQVDGEEAARAEAERQADVRARYGMTDEALAGVKDRKPVDPRSGRKSA